MNAASRHGTAESERFACERRGRLLQGCERFGRNAASFLVTVPQGQRRES